MKIESPIVIALAKGRILKEALALFEKIGLKTLEDVDSSRKLKLKTNNPNIEILVVRTTDVATYVQYGVADLGVVGKDSLIEQGYEGICEMLDLQIAKCKLMTATVAGRDLRNKSTLTVATKYVESTKSFYAKKGIHTNVIKLYGSMELAPIVGLSDCIVDLVDTGSTLKANGLEAGELVLSITTRLIAGRSALKTKNKAITAFVDTLQNTLKDNAES